MRQENRGELADTEIPSSLGPPLLLLQGSVGAPDITREGGQPSHKMSRRILTYVAHLSGLSHFGALAFFGHRRPRPFLGLLGVISFVATRWASAIFSSAAHLLLMCSALCLEWKSVGFVVITTEGLVLSVHVQTVLSFW